MTFRVLLAGALAVALAFLSWFFIHRPSAPPSAAPDPIAPIAASPREEPAPGPKTPSAPAARQPAPLSQGQAALEAIQKSASTYDAKEVPALARYLDSDSAEIREAALQGLIQLGDSAAAPYLKTAAARTKIVQEQLDLLKAAEFLSLPSWHEHRPEPKNSPPPKAP